MKAKGFARKVISYGPGGFKCPCCGPAPNKRREERQQNRRVLDRTLDAIEREEQKPAPIGWFLFPEFDHSDEEWAAWYEWKARQ
jgi:hypothetical protein